ncbi:MipA/OmpV family protein [Marinobacter nauticus]|uniref:MipA/OmpV family protein n=1 Tax=Marinobacter nauticus TaxID=2743 RepID=UPI00161D8F72|nr:MipA/OmpV family protein [Marinobacter nauticus]
MKKAALQVATFVGALTFLCMVNAAENRVPLVPLPSIDDFTNGDGWGFGLGVSVEYETAYEGSDEFEFEADPAGGVQWRTGENIFFWAGEAVGWRTLVKDSWLFQTSIGYEEGREESDSEDGRLGGLGESDSGVAVLLEARYALTDDWRYFLDGRVSAGEIGTLGIFGAGTCLACQADGTGWEVGAAVTFHDSKLANRDFGVTTQQSIDSGLPETDVDSGYRSTGVNVSYRNYLGENWQIFGEALYEAFGSDVSDSPITRNDYEAEIGVGFIYVF